MGFSLKSNPSLRKKLKGIELSLENKLSEKLKEIANELDVSMTKLALAWCLLNKNVSTVILGASKIEQLEENLASVEVLTLLTEETQEKIQSILNSADTEAGDPAEDGVE